MDCASGDIRWRFPSSAATIDGMAVTTTNDAAAIVPLLDAVLIQDPVRNTILGTVRAVLREPGAAGWCAHNGRALAARSGPAHPVALTEGWTDLHALAGALTELPSVAGIGGPVAAVDHLVDLLGRPPERRVAQRLYSLDRVVEPVGVEGRPRLAGTGDVDLVASWTEPFHVETWGAVPPDFDARQSATTAIERSRTWIWQDERGAPVSMAVRRPPAAGVSRIGPVYTPPEHRGHGYASAVTARAASDVLDIAAVPVLYTDLGNATSNKIYRAIGFRPVTDRLSVVFEDG
jgi:GNAT superfamily N-acetyltransferase